MKTNTSRLILSAVLIGSITIGTQSCKSKKTVAQTTGAVEITVPFNTNEFSSDKDNFRARASGNSPDLTTAKKIALQNAKSEMAGLIQTTIKKVTDQYTNQRTVGSTQEFSNKFEELAREVTNQQLTDVRIIGEKIFQEKNTTYTYWIAIEANKQTVYDGVTKSVSKDKKLEQDYDKKKFEDIFNQEIEKLAKEKAGN